jgi:hypothetical protein
MIAVRCEDSPTGDHEPRPDRWGDEVCVWCLEDTAAKDEDGEIPDRTIRQNGPQVIGERCPWCGALVLDSEHSRSHD